MEKLILYSNNCPKCKVLKTKLEQKNIAYQETDDFSTVIERGILSMPVLQNGEKFMDFTQAVKYVNEIQEL